MIPEIKRIDRPAIKPSHLAPIDKAFCLLWTEDLSWSPIAMTAAGWKTITSRSGKKVPLTAAAVEQAYRKGDVVGKRFGRLSRYMMIDVDASSRWHPDQEGLSQILEAMESIGLCRVVIVRSSFSGGLHLYFPLPESINSWALANGVQSMLANVGVDVKSGQCELFPNKRAYDADHNGHRLPLQAGSVILDDDLNPVSTSQSFFVSTWESAAKGQDFEVTKSALMARPLVTKKRSEELPPISWTRFGESNEVMRKLVNYGSNTLGLKTIAELSRWMNETAPKLSGYKRFASRKSKNDLERQRWAARWAKSNLRSRRVRTAKASLSYNDSIAADAKFRVMNALRDISDVCQLGIKKLWLSISEKSKELFGVGVGWKVFNKHRKTILADIENSRKLGLSRIALEDENLPLEKATPAASQNWKEESNRHTQLGTSRCVTSCDRKGLKPSSTPDVSAVGTLQNVLDKGAGLLGDWVGSKKSPGQLSFF